MTEYSCCIGSVSLLSPASLSPSSKLPKKDKAPRTDKAAQNGISQNQPRSSGSLTRPVTSKHAGTRLRAVLSDSEQSAEISPEEVVQLLRGGHVSKRVSSPGRPHSAPSDRRARNTAERRRAEKQHENDPAKRSSSMRFSKEDVVLPRQGGRAAWTTMSNCLDESAAGVASTTELQINLQTLDMVGSRASCPIHLVRALEDVRSRAHRKAHPISLCFTPRCCRPKIRPGRSNLITSSPRYGCSKIRPAQAGASGSTVRRSGAPSNAQASSSSALRTRNHQLPHGYVPPIFFHQLSRGLRFP
mmetsp:Transcript_61692/g.169694  ORF Transcript_61692/g.169694 Transcript_61692/m.169694 type:complete len:301 (+) Transcript_61692:142-1044(+)